MDTIFITDLKIYTTIGIHAWEQVLKQPIYLDVELNADTSRSAEDDSILTTLNYEEVSNEIDSFLQEHSFLLVETLANRLANHLLQRFATEAITLKVSKKNTTIPAHAVGVIITRKRTV